LFGLAAGFVFSVFCAESDFEDFARSGMYDFSSFTLQISIKSRTRQGSV